MFVRAKKHPTAKQSRWSVLICYNKRQNKKVIQHTVKRIGIATCEYQLEKMLSMGTAWIKTHDSMSHVELAALSKQNKKLRINKMKNVQLKNIREIKRINVGYEDIFGGLFDDIGFSQIVDKEITAVLKATVFGKIYGCESKKRISYELDKRFEYDVSEDKIYRMMDALNPNINNIKSTVFNYVKSYYGEKINVMFFDVTTLALESIEVDKLRNFGFSKDCKFNNTQVVLALATTEEGLPIGYKLFPGNTAEVTTLISCVNEWREDIEIGSVTVVGDSAIMSKKNLEYLKHANMQYIIAYPLLKAPANILEEALEEKDYSMNFYGDELYWAKKIELDNERSVIVTYNKKRHKKDLQDRERMLDKIRKRLGTQNETGNAKKLISNRGYIKYTKVDGQDTACVNDEKVKAHSRLDGMHAITTNCKDKSTLELLSRYRGLWVIEESFRINKTNLKIRPIFHRKQDRIESHIAICFITYTIMRVAQIKLKKQGVHLSIASIKEAITDVQASLLCDVKTGLIYKMLSAIPKEAEMIYDAFGIKQGLSQVHEFQAV